MRAKLPISLIAWVVVFAGWTALFGLNFLVGWLRHLPLSRGEILVFSVAAAGFVVTGTSWLIRQRLRRRRQGAQVP